MVKWGGREGAGRVATPKGKCFGWGKRKKNEERRGGGVVPGAG